MNSNDVLYDRALSTSVAVLARALSAADKDADAMALSLGFGPDTVPTEVALAAIASALLVSREEVQRLKGLLEAKEAAATH